MLGQIAVFLIETLIGFFIFLTLLRFLLQAVRAPFRNPIGQFAVALTNWLVLPLRKVIPPLRQYDLASLVGAWLLVVLKVFLLWLLMGRMTAIAPMMIVTVLGLTADFLRLVMLIVFVQIIVSWVSPYNPLSAVLNALTAPFYRPFSFIKPIGQFDLSPFFLLICISVLLIVLNGLVPRGWPFGL